MYKITGIIELIYSEVIISEKFKKRDFILKDNSQYPQLITFQLTKDNCSIMDNFNIGEEIEVSFNLRGKEWISPKGEKKYFNTFEAWRITKIGSQIKSEKDHLISKSASFLEPDPDDIFPF
jgi:hypothetical protein